MDLAASNGVAKQLQEIGSGAAFDVVDAVRLLAKHALARELASGGSLGASANAEDDMVGLLNARMLKALRDAGFADSAAIRAASDEDLLAVNGLGEKGLALVRERVGRA